MGASAKQITEALSALFGKSGTEEAVSPLKKEIDRRVGLETRRVPHPQSLREAQQQAAETPTPTGESRGRNFDVGEIQDKEGHTTFFLIDKADESVPTTFSGSSFAGDFDTYVANSIPDASEKNLLELVNRGIITKEQFDDLIGGPSISVPGSTGFGERPVLDTLRQQGLKVGDALASGVFSDPRTIRYAMGRASLSPLLKQLQGDFTGGRVTGAKSRSHGPGAKISIPKARKFAERQGLEPPRDLSLPENRAGSAGRREGDQSQFRQEVGDYEPDLYDEYGPELARLSDTGPLARLRETLTNIASEGSTTDARNARRILLDQNSIEEFHLRQMEETLPQTDIRDAMAAYVDDLGTRGSRTAALRDRVMREPIGPMTPERAQDEENIARFLGEYGQDLRDRFARAGHGGGDLHGNLRPGIIRFMRMVVEDEEIPF